MRLVSSAAQVRELDRRIIEELGLPGIALMELASRAVAEVVLAHAEAEARRGVLVVCGAGNNGGDGFGVARWLHGWGFPVRLLVTKEPARGDALVMRRLCQRLGIPEVDALEPAGLLIDAVFGTGLDRPVSGGLTALFRAMEAHPAPVLAVDLPSGLSADTGAVLGAAVPAAHTVTFGRLKPAFFTKAGARLSGRVHLADIGLEAAPGARDLALGEVPEPADLAPVVPRRAPTTHKTREGHLLVVAGSTWMAGAAVLACRGALAAGVGLVTLLAPRGAHSRLGALPPEAMLLDGGPGDLLDASNWEGDGPDLSRFHAVAAGPGLAGGIGLPAATARWLEGVWRGFPGAVVFDADALPWAVGPGPGPRLITPHPGEAARLLGCGAHEVEADRFGAVGRLARDRTALLKGRWTLVADPAGRISINPTGSPVLASGGTGDVLTGVSGALLARGLSARDAARLAVWVHGRAGERLEQRRLQGWTAGDVALEIPAALSELTA